MPSLCHSPKGDLAQRPHRIRSQTEGRVGILGGGQLAWMLARAAKDLKWDTSIFAQSLQESAPLAGYDTTLGRFVDSHAIEKWARSVDVVLIESELIPFEPLSRAMASCGRPIVPSLKALEISRHKLRQKHLFAKLGIPTARWFELDEGEDRHPEELLAHLFKVFPTGFVFKWSLGGYDGKGVFVVRPQDLEPASNIPERPSRASGHGQPKEALLHEVSLFLSTATQNRVPIYVEELVDYLCEGALTAALSSGSDPEFFSFPMVLSEQDRGTCFRVRSASCHPTLPWNQLEQSAQESAQKIARELGFVGTFALEFFITRNHGLVLNEMAPRVHNSSHFTQIVPGASQFHQHLRACLGLSMAQPSYPPFYGMTNILGPDSYEGPVTSCPEIPVQNLSGRATGGHLLVAGVQIPETAVFWYDKPASRPRRKLGHLHSCALTLEALQSDFATIDQALSRWHDSLTRQQH